MALSHSSIVNSSPSSLRGAAHFYREQCYQNRTGHRPIKASGQRFIGRTAGSIGSTADFFKTIVIYIEYIYTYKVK